MYEAILKSNMKTIIKGQEKILEEIMVGTFQIR